MSSVFAITGGPQSYDWGAVGSSSKVAHYAQADASFSYDQGKPYAELWMGTHPSLPSKVASSQASLLEHLKAHPELLGEGVRKYYASDDLPFLFKVLAIGKALSIQAHPDKALGKKLHSERPDVYKDANHKPEMAIALTEFSGFCGFRPLPEIKAFLESVPEFAAVVGSDAADAFVQAVASAPRAEELSRNATCIKEASSGSADAAKLQQALKDVFAGVMQSPEATFKPQLQQLIARYQKETGAQKAQDATPGSIEELVLRLNEQFPDDIGVFCSFLLNVVYLRPGQACFLQANEPHAYLSGSAWFFARVWPARAKKADIIECMATSDNVVRAGLTPKLRDVPTLLSMLTYTWGPPSTQLMAPQPYKSTKSTTLYDPPIEEFSVLLVDASTSKTESLPAVDGPGILIVTALKGQGTLRFNEETLPVTQEGQIFFVGAGTALQLEGALVAYLAFVEPPR